MDNKVDIMKDLIKADLSPEHYNRAMSIYTLSSPNKNKDKPKIENYSPEPDKIYPSFGEHSLINNKMLG